MIFQLNESVFELDRMIFCCVVDFGLTVFSQINKSKPPFIYLMDIKAIIQKGFANHYFDTHSIFHQILSFLQLLGQ